MLGVRHWVITTFDPRTTTFAAQHRNDTARVIQTGEYSVSNKSKTEYKQLFYPAATKFIGFRMHFESHLVIFPATFRFWILIFIPLDGLQSAISYLLRMAAGRHGICTQHLFAEQYLLIFAGRVHALKCEKVNRFGISMRKDWQRKCTF